MVEHKNLKPRKLAETTENQKSIEPVDNMRFTVRNDYAFKKLFGRKENIIILQEFLSVVLELDKVCQYPYLR